MINLFGKTKNFDEKFEEEWKEIRKRDGKAQIDYLVQEGNVKVVWGGLGEGPG